MLKALLQGRRLVYVLAIAALVLAVGGGYSLAANSSAGTVKVCVAKGTRVLTLAHGKCKHGGKSLSWNKAGRAGANGTNGTNGANGTNGTNAASTIVVRKGAQATGVGAISTSTNGVIVDSFGVTGPSSTQTPAGGTPDGWWLDVKTTSGTADFTPEVVCASP